MRCVDVVELVTEYAEGRLSPGERPRFQLHLGGCGGCRAYVRQMRATVRALGRIERPAPSGEIEGELVRRFRRWSPAAPSVADDRETNRRVR
ncbi:MAG: zf-HC2 domain-containing protein [Deltaproteobacteria bacterium]|jgi:anti-sigma factor RsiW|nr:zf-HC2 domain-containing protein [Deltaproteobacteria bacterium]